MASVEEHAQGEHMYSRDYAIALDADDSLRHMRDEFLIPSKADLKVKTLPESGKISPF